MKSPKIMIRIQSEVTLTQLAVAKMTGNSGVLGTGNTDDLYVPPTTPIDLGDNFVTQEIDCGYYHCCGVSSNRTLKCWGQYLYFISY